MPNRNTTFHLVLAPDCQLTAVAPDVETCIGYLGHPFLKKLPWAFNTILFLVVRWDSAIERVGNGSHV
jgi:hypothetical protein